MADPDTTGSVSTLPLQQIAPSHHGYPHHHALVLSPQAGHYAWNTADMPGYNFKNAMHPAMHMGALNSPHVYPEHRAAAAHDWYHLDQQQTGGVYTSRPAYSMRFAARDNAAPKRK